MSRAYKEPKFLATGVAPEGPSIHVIVKLNRGLIEDVRLIEGKKPGLEWTVESDEKKSPLMDEVIHWLCAYAKKKSSPLPSGIKHHRTSFTSEVWKKLGELHFGESTTYSGLAASLGNPRASRAVGNACGQNPWALFIPCHRVLGKSKSKLIGGFSQGIEVKKILLEFEQIPF